MRSDIDLSLPTSGVRPTASAARRSDRPQRSSPALRARLPLLTSRSAAGRERAELGGMRAGAIGGLGRPHRGDPFPRGRTLRPGPLLPVGVSRCQPRALLKCSRRTIKRAREVPRARPRLPDCACTNIPRVLPRVPDGVCPNRFHKPHLAPQDSRRPARPTRRLKPDRSRPERPAVSEPNGPVWDASGNIGVAPTDCRADMIAGPRQPWGASFSPAPQPAPSSARSSSRPSTGVTVKPRPPATNPRSPTARRSSRPAASPSATVTSPFRITRTQPGKPRLQTPLDLRCVRPPVSSGLHDDRHPSLQLYDDGSWYCFGACRRGGTIYDFAAALWLTSTKGRAFIELRNRLAAELDLV